MNQASLRVLAVATVMSIPALAEDHYIFGYDNGGGAASKLLALHGSAGVRAFDLGWYAAAAWQPGSSHDAEMAGQCVICATGSDAAFSELAGGVGYGPTSRPVGASASPRALGLYDGVVADLNASLARGDRQAASGVAVLTGALETPSMRAPGTYALMLAGLGAVGFVATRRRS